MLGRKEWATRCPGTHPKPSRDTVNRTCRESGGGKIETPLDGGKLNSRGYEKDPRIEAKVHDELAAISNQVAVAHVDVRDAPGPILITGCIPALTYDGGLLTRKPSQGEVNSIDRHSQQCVLGY